MLINLTLRKSLFLLLVLAAPSYAKPLYVGVGPSYGYSRSGDSDGWNDRIGVGARLRCLRLGAEIEIHYKNEYYLNNLVWVKSWPLTASVLVYPLHFFYAGAGIGSYDLYIDYDQSAAGLEALENESKHRTGLHICAGLEFNMTKTSAAAIEVRYCWIDYRLAPLPGVQSIDSNALSIKATVYFKLGIEP
jgi:hypothetical protein